MSDDETFLRRWSRRKQAASAPAPAPVEKAAPDEAAPEPASQAAPPEPAVDLSTLPPVESIGAETDIRGFLQKGVPLDLTRAALRRAWSEDPLIRNFIEVAENQWDFATGTDIPGFGSLEAGTDVGRMVADIMGDLGEPRPAPAPAPTMSGDELAARAVESPPPLVEARTTAAQQQAEATEETAAVAGDDPPSDDAAARQSTEIVATHEEPAPRRHGGALPR